ncbi:MAG: hypothetical protein MNPFHGCM_01014 [Gemmatimonadaceae bacterium]|nr:hypothetical protein [Gemmatimonadaceae bacterium]
MMYGRVALAGMLGAMWFSSGAAAQGERRPTRDREAMQQRFEQRFAEVVRQRVGLDDGQMAKLTELNRRFEGKRHDLFLRDRQIRIGMREELADGVTPNEDRVRKLLDDQMKLQRERVDLMESEQQELTTFMTAIQRARYFGIQEQMRRKVEELRGPPGGSDHSMSRSERSRRNGRTPADTTVR